MIRHYFPMLLALALPSHALAQDTHRVPADYLTIQEAIDASVSGDTVLVSPGTYFENLVINFRSISLVSAGGASVTTIDGGGVATVVSIRLGLAGQSRVQGFTIQNGQGTSYTYGVAGGVQASTCDDLTIADCVIRDNAGYSPPDFNSGTCGGLVLNNCDNYLVERCVIERNVGGSSADVADHYGGVGGVFLASGDGTMRSCVVRDNQGGAGAATGNNTNGGAGGVLFYFPEPGFIVDCTIEANRGGACGSGNANLGGSGGIEARGRHLRVDRCRIVGNSGATGGSRITSRAGPGGVSMRAAGFTYAGPSIPDIVNSLVAENVGGDAALPGTNNLGGAGGIALRTGDRYSILNCTLVNNVGGVGGAGGLSLRVVPPTQDDVTEVTNCVLWNNVGWAPGDDAIQVNTGPDPVVSYSIVDSSWTGEGNQHVDPRLMDPAAGDYALRCSSPAVDAGTLETVAPVGDKDIDGDRRAIGHGIDIGADEFVHEVFPTYCSTSVHSGGFGARISAVGCHSITTNDLTLIVKDLPGTPGLFVFGPGTSHTPFGDGFRCVSGSLNRLPTMPAMGARVAMRLNLTGLPGIAPGVTSYFQFWFRDQAAGGAGFNLSDGVQVDFTH